MSRVVLVRAWAAVLVLGMLGVAAPAAAAPQDPLRVGGVIREPRKLTTVDPVYPEQALTAGLQGVVILEATIDREGNVRDARVLRSQPMLDDAALTAVRQWKYSPTLFNGEPVELLMTVVVNFQLPSRQATQAPGKEPSPEAGAATRVGGDIKEPRIIKFVGPRFPVAAKADRVSDAVILEATIATDGTVKSARVLRSAHVFDDAALDAVRQWVYTPTLVKGEPVELVMTVVINFMLK